MYNMLALRIRSRTEKNTTPLKHNHFTSWLFGFQTRSLYLAFRRDVILKRESKNLGQTAMLVMLPKLRLAFAIMCQSW